MSEKNKETKQDKQVVQDNKDTLIDFYQYQYRRKIWQARVRRQKRG